MTRKEITIYVVLESCDNDLLVAFPTEDEAIQYINMMQKATSVYGPGTRYYVETVTYRLPIKKGSVTYVNDPERVSERFDEMLGLLSAEGHLTPGVANIIGYFKAHIERDSFSFAEGGDNDEE